MPWTELKQRWRQFRSAQSDLSAGSLVDADTRTYWRSGSSASTTVVEVETPPHDDDVRHLIGKRQSERGRSDRPRGNPAFAEALFVELMRAGQYERAFFLLAPVCRRAWRNHREFAKAQDDNAMRHLQGVNVRGVRLVSPWTDPVVGETFQHAAELDVEYSFGDAGNTVKVARTVHLVGHKGKWCSLAMPQ